MKNPFLIYVVCKDILEAKKISKCLLDNKLCACVNILPRMFSFFFWPEGSNKIASSEESVLLIKTIKAKYKKIEKAVIEMHSYEIPCIFGFNPLEIHLGYKQWMQKQHV